MMEFLMCPGIGISCLAISYFILWFRVGHIEDRNDERVDKKIDWLKKFDINSLDRRTDRLYDLVDVTNQRLAMEIEFLKKEIENLKK